MSTFLKTSLLAVGLAAALLGSTAVNAKPLAGINHMGIVTNQKAVNAIAEDVATRGAGQS